MMTKKRYSSECIYEPPALSAVPKGQRVQRPPPTSADDLVCVLCHHSQHLNLVSNYDAVGPIASWNTGPDPEAFEADLDSIFIQDEQAASHNAIWIEPTEVEPLSPPLSRDPWANSGEAGM